jgi:ribose transport system permease protein
VIAMRIPFDRSSRSGLRLSTFALPLLLFVALCFLSPSFLSVQNLGNISGQVAALLIVSLGQLVVALIGCIDLSVGAALSLATTIIVSVDPAYAPAVALLAGIAIGLVNGIGVTYVGVHPLIMTIASMTFVQGWALFIHPVPGGTVADYLGSLATSPLFGIPAPFLWCVGTVGLTAFVLSKTRFGLRLFAIGASPASAARNGVPVKSYSIACYVICSAAATIAGIFISGRVSSGDATVGASFALDSITAIAMGGVQLAGGTGSVTGVVLGTITLGLMTNGMNLLGISPFLRTAATGALLLLAISMQRRNVIGV